MGSVQCDVLFLVLSFLCLRNVRLECWWRAARIVGDENKKWNEPIMLDLSTCLGTDNQPTIASFNRNGYYGALKGCSLVVQPVWGWWLLLLVWCSLHEVVALGTRTTEPYGFQRQQPICRLSQSLPNTLLDAIWYGWKLFEQCASKACSFRVFFAVNKACPFKYYHDS